MADHYTHIHDSYQPDIFLSSTGLLNSVQGGESSLQSQFDDRDLDTLQNGFNLRPYADASTTDSSSPSTEGPGASPPLSIRPDTLGGLRTASHETRKLRKDKLRIELAPDQPPTTQGRPRARVFVACIQCRGRKIRCDGAKPKCYHCSQRGGNEQCSYDPIPKRRGPDRVQGARTRGIGSNDDGEPPPRRRRRRLETVDQAASGSYGITPPRVTDKPPMLDNLEDLIFLVQPQQYRVHTLDPGFELSESSAQFNTTTSNNQILTVESTRTGHPHVVRLDERNIATYHTPGTSLIPAAYMQHRLGLEPIDITPDPSVQFSRETWFDHLCDLYAVSVRVPYSSVPLELAQHNGSISQIVEDVRFIFRHSPHWFSFLNVPRFYDNFMDPVRRSQMQPSLLLSLLAVSTFLQSTEQAFPEEGQRMAMLLRDEAQGYLEASLHARALDVELAQAAWMLSFFEVCAHPRHLTTRIDSSLYILDSIIRSLAMTHLDANDPTASKFVRRAVPVMKDSSEQSFFTPRSYPSSTTVSPTQQYVQQNQFAADTTTRGSRCSCGDLSLGMQWPEGQTQVPLWASTPMWNREWTEGEVKKEECRRLCWSALMLVSGQTSYADAVNWRIPDFFMIEPSNYSILFPGESLLPSHPGTYSDTMSGKDTVWALYPRAMLLWNACVRMRNDTSIGDLDRSNFAMRAWVETEAIEKALQWHTCGVEGAFMYHGREILFNTRMCISYEFQRFIPHVFIGLNRTKSEEWLRAQGKRAKAVIFAMHTITGNHKHNLLHRPWFMWWFMGQVYRALTLWQHDHSLTIALDVSKAFLEPIEFLINFYPGQAQQRRLEELQGRVLAASATAGYVPTPIEML